MALICFSRVRWRAFEPTEIHKHWSSSCVKYQLRPAHLPNPHLHPSAMPPMRPGPDSVLTFMSHALKPD